MNKLIARVTDPEEREKGFTLIELLVVIIIIGILAAIAIPIFLNQKKKAADATVKSDVRNAVSVVESANTDGSAPTAVTGITANTAYGTGGDQLVVSSGNKLSVAVGSVAGTYCVVGTNPNGSQKSYWYSSAQGKTLTSAPTTPTTDPCVGVAAP